MFVFSNLATSLDGKIATAGRVHFPLGTPTDRKQMQVLRKKSDAIIFGASTLRSYKRTCRITSAKQQPINAILSRSLEGISPRWPFFGDSEVRRILFVTSAVPKAQLHLFRKTCEVITVKNATQVIRELSKRGVQDLLVEGGGEVMWFFVKDNLIDEFHVTLTPRILGGTEAPTLVDGTGFSPFASLKLTLQRVKKIGDELFLVYHKIF
ncbi:RibD family protein [Bdellovibrionota bacterium FG-2]